MTYIMSCVWLDYMVKYFQCKNCVGSSPKTKKCVASFLVPVYILVEQNRCTTRKARNCGLFWRFEGKKFKVKTVDAFQLKRDSNPRQLNIVKQIGRLLRNSSLSLPIFYEKTRTKF